MKNKVFSLKLYIEGLKQTKLISIITFVILAIQAVAIPVGQVIETITYAYDQTVTGVDFEMLNPMLFAVIYIVSPLLVLSLFSFLNKRSSSDFYHSISDTRVSLFLSFFAAICTHIIALSMLSTLVGIITNLLFQQYFVLNYINIFVNLFKIISASLYAAAATMLAMTLTGTLLTNIAVTGLIFILPDYVIAMIKSMVISEMPIARNNNGVSQFLPVGFNYLSFEGAYSNNDLGASIYTLVLAIVIGFVAHMIFRIRKSESAGYPALNKYLQSTVRILFCMVVCLFACGGIFSLSVYDLSFDGIDVFYIVLIYIAALIVYFLYELITTRKFSALVKTFPALLIVLVLNFACIIGMNCVYNSYLDFKPTANEIDYIRFDGDDDDEIYDLRGYLENKCSKIKIKDENIKSLVSAILSENIDRIESGTFYNVSNNEEWNQFNVVISSGGIERSRYLRISNEQYNTILEFLRNNDEYRQEYITLPDSKSVTANLWFNGENLSSKDSKRIYNIFRSEVAELGFVEWYKLLNHLNDTTDASNIAEIEIIVVEGTEIYEIYVPLYMTFNESVEEYVKLAYNENDSKTIKDSLTDIKNSNISYIDIYYYNTDVAYNSYYNIDVMEKVSDEFAQFAKYLEPANEYDAGDIIVQVYMEKYNEDTNIGNDTGEEYYYDYDVLEDYSAFFKFTGDITNFQELIESYY